MTGEQKEHRFRRRTVRIAFVLYAAALTLGTHWPELSAPSAGPDHLDKFVHFVAFAIGTLLLGLTGWLGSIEALRTAVFALSIGVAWSVADELTQGLPGLGRTVSGLDLVANLTGVAAASLTLVLIGLRASRVRSPETF